MSSAPLYGSSLSHFYNDRRVNTLGIDAHPTEDAIVVTYELEASLVGDLGDTMLEESKQCQKM